MTDTTFYMYPTELFDDTTFYMYPTELFDDKFGLSCSDINEEEGEDTYCHRVEACLTKESVEDFGSISVSSPSGFPLDESEGNSERATGDTFKR